LRACTTINQFKLDGPEVVELSELVCLAFDSIALKTVLRRLNRRLDELVRSAPFKDQVQELIEKAVQEGWIRDLIEAIRTERPLRPDIQRYALRFQGSSADSPTTPARGMDPERSPSSPARIGRQWESLGPERSTNSRSWLLAMLLAVAAGMLIGVGVAHDEPPPVPGVASEVSNAKSQVIDSRSLEGSLKAANEESANWEAIFKALNDVVEKLEKDRRVPSEPNEQTAVVHIPKRERIVGTVPSGYVLSGFTPRSGALGGP
jgi:hypothetical protein